MKDMNPTAASKPDYTQHEMRGSAKGTRAKKAGPGGAIVEGTFKGSGQ